MNKIIVNFWQNYTFCNDLKDDESFNKFYNALRENWIRYSMPAGTSCNYRIYPIHIKSLNTYRDLKQMEKAFNMYKETYYKQVMVFYSLLDINTSIKKALKFACILDEIGYDVYFLSINPKLPWSCYYVDYLHFFGIFDLTFFKDKRIRSEKYDPKLLEFVADLRLCNPPIKYRVIERLTGVPKSTIIDYMARNNLTPDFNKTGVDELSENDLDRYYKLVTAGYINPRIL